MEKTQHVYYGHLTGEENKPKILIGLPKSEVVALKFKLFLGVLPNA